MRATASEIESAIVPHLDAAFNLARWLLREDSAARDAVQSACVRAITYFASLRGPDARNWFLGIVRNVCFTTLHERSVSPLDALGDCLDEDLTAGDLQDRSSPDPVEALQGKVDRALVNQALRELPAIFREILILREMEDLPYADIAHVIGAPLGTVMSRLARARALFRVRYTELTGGPL